MFIVIKNEKYTFLILIIYFFCFQNCWGQKKDTGFEYFPFDSDYSTRIVNKTVPSILLLRLFRAESGVPHHILSLYKGLYEKGININIAVIKGTMLQKRLVEARLPHYAFSWIGGVSNKERLDLFSSYIYKICKDLNVKIIHVHGWVSEFIVAKDVAKQLNLMVVQQHHSYMFPEQNVYNGADALLLASPDVAKKMIKNNSKCDSGCKKINFIEFLPPLCDENKFLNFTSSMSKDQFFLDNFGIKLSSAPIICMIANFYRCKNHEGLLEALKILISKYKVPFQCVLAGSSAAWRMKEIKKLCADLGLNEYVKFIGFVKDTPSLLFYSDIVILPSKGDAFPITILEAAFMHKPIILSQKAGSADLIIIDNKTGLLCDPYNPENIASKIKALISDSDLRFNLGKSAFDHVVKNFSNDSVLNLYVDFYKRIVHCKK